MQKCYFSEKDCAFFIEHVDRYDKLKEKISKKIKS